MTERKDTNSSGRAPDIIRLIRSIQHMEGNPECFATAVHGCDRLDCVWREYCLKESDNDKK